MKAALIHAATQIQVEDVPDPALRAPTDAIVRVIRSCICGSDLHTYRHGSVDPQGATIGHEFVGVVESIGGDVERIHVGDFVIAPFAWSDGTCVHCRGGLPTSCLNGGLFGSGAAGGAQAEFVRVPQADGTLVVVPGMDASSELLPDLLALSDVMGTGYHAAVAGRVTSETDVTVIGDGAVGLLAVLSARLQGARRIILMGRHRARTSLGVDFGATDVVESRGEEGIAAVQELTSGEGTRVVIEAVGFRDALQQAFGVVRPGGTISRVGVPQYDEASIGFRTMFGPNITLTGGIAPVRRYIPRLLPHILSGAIRPGRVFDRTETLEDIAAGYQAMADRTALKVMITPP